MHRAGASNKNQGPRGINYISITRRIHGIAKCSGTDQHEPLLQMGKLQESLNNFRADMWDIVVT